jgi:hypothetical protein
MNPQSGGLTYVDASGWTALVNANDTLHCHLADTWRVQLFPMRRSGMLELL